MRHEDVRVGQPVWLNSGSPILTVTAVVGATVFVSWMDNGRLTRDKFDAAMLRATDPSGRKISGVFDWLLGRRLPRRYGTARSAAVPPVMPDEIDSPVEAILGAVEPRERYAIGFVFSRFVGSGVPVVMLTKANKRHGGADDGIVTTVERGQDPQIELSEKADAFLTTPIPASEWRHYITHYSAAGDREVLVYRADVVDPKVRKFIDLPLDAPRAGYWEPTQTFSVRMVSDSAAWMVPLLMSARVAFPVTVYETEGEAARVDGEAV